MKKIIIAVGCDLSTTALSVVGITADGELVFFSVPMSGATLWPTPLRGQPAFDLAELPGLLLEALKGLKSQDCEFAPNGVISWSVRQHDTVIADSLGRPLMPALSWQCDAATAEVKMLRAMGAEAIVGRLEPRLLLPKLLWALKEQPNLEHEIGTVMTTGDLITMQLASVQTICSSEALSNGLLNQGTRKFARGFIDSIPGLKSAWFPPVVKSGQLILSDPDNSFYQTCWWDPVRSLLPDWRVVAGLGDNHAGAVGSGLVGRDTIVISAGTSGTVTRAVKLGTATAGAAMQFEYYDDTLLLLMMADCASWYDRFVKEFGGGKSYAELDAWTGQGPEVYSIPYPKTPQAPFPGWFPGLSLGIKVRTMQRSIAYQLAELFKKMWKDEVTGDRSNHIVQKVVLTGGLTRSPYFCEMMKDWLRNTGFDREIRVSSRTGPLANQAAAMGALINAMVGAKLFPSLAVAIEALCLTRKL